MGIMFVNRTNELQFLKQEYNGKGYSFIVVYGRRRVGKTELIKKFIKDKPYVYFLVSQEPTEIQLQRLIKLISEFFSERIPSINDWIEAMKYIGEKFRKKKFVLIIDEFPYLAESNKSIPSYFQYLIDEFLKNYNSMLILSGSSVSFMESEVLGHKSPLYGRRTGQIDLEPFDFGKIKLLIKRPIKERIETLAIFGNVPMYLNFFDKDKSLENNILDNILNKKAYLYKEPELILKQEFREPAKYVSIMGAIANGNRHLNKISMGTQILSSTLPKYIENLIKIRLIGREICVTERQKKSKKSLYYIKDGLFNFWFRFIEPNLSDVETNPRNVLKNIIMPGLSSFVSGTFEDVCQEFVRKKWNYGVVGKWWFKEIEVDIVGLNKKENKIIFAECKWQDNVDAVKILNQLKEKAVNIRWHNKNRKQEFVVFARSFSHKTKNAYDLKDLDKFF